ncbi:branched-chain amino acid aminotransferase II [Hysterangium stoloniferum]|nr:branched-chain amino acid aminotransferase II [Hysterangium stoloniferum]
MKAAATAARSFSNVNIPPIYAASTRTSHFLARSYSQKVKTDLTTSELTALPGIQPSKLQVIPNQNPKALPPPQDLVFGKTFTDHMLTIPWKSTTGWETPTIRPCKSFLDGPLALEPSSTVLHYAQTLFEGMKAYRDERGKVTLFRPDMNMKRMNTSAQRIALPTFHGDSFLELIKALVRLDRHWIPQLPGYSLYVRPTLIGTQPAIGVGPPNEALLFVICSPVGPYYASGFKPVALYGTTEYVRAFHGGTGGYKLGANYAPCVVPQMAAAAQGYSQNLWLHGPEHHLTEVGTMNLFVVFRKGDGTLELATPPLDGMILPGVTRDSVIALAKGHASKTLVLQGLPELEINERPVTMKEVKQAAKNGSLVELFGTGTAAIICPVNRIGYLGEDIIVPTGNDTTGLGPVSQVMLAEIAGRQLGTIQSDWSVVVAE